MNVLISSDHYYSEFELIKTDTPEKIPGYIKKLIKGINAKIPGVLLGNENTMSSTNIVSLSDIIYYVCDYDN